jgi:sec-independent protein translocase protein TatC
MDDKKLPFVEHLRELRIRLRNAVIALMIAWIIAFAFSELLFAFLARPLVQAFAERGVNAADLNYGGLTEPFWTYFELSLWAGIFLASPVIFHQIWKFIAPGLYQKEKRVAIPFAVFSALCFIGGALFCYFLVLPAAFRFFLSYSAKNLGRMKAVFGIVDINAAGGTLGIKPTLFMSQYLDTVTKFLLGFGIVFEMPMLIFFLSWVGLVTHKSLWKFNKYAIVISFIVGAILTPGPDIVSQLMMATPMIVLYNLSILVAFVVTRSRAKRLAAEAAGTPEEPPPDDEEDK